MACGFGISVQAARPCVVQSVQVVASRTFQVGSYRYRSLIEGLYTL